jgi:ABC transporter substrate binding protein
MLARLASGRGLVEDRRTVSVLSRRELLALGGGLLVGSRSAGAQTLTKPIRVGWLSGGIGAQPGAPPRTAFGEGLREGGFVLDQNVVLDDQIARSIAQAARQGAGALLAFTSPIVNLNLKPIAAAALEHHLPAICGFVPTFAEAGGLLAYGPDFADLFRRAAGYVVAILKGAAASELPIQRPTKFPLVINLRTARALGLAIPPTMLAHADQVIE